jgi:hypothetical protein
MSGVDAGLLEQLPNEFAAFSPVVFQAFVGPLARHQHAAPSNTQIFGPMGLALATSRD